MMDDISRFLSPQFSKMRFTGVMQSLNVSAKPPTKDHDQIQLSHNACCSPGRLTKKERKLGQREEEGSLGNMMLVSSPAESGPLSSIVYRGSQLRY